MKDLIHKKALLYSLDTTVTPTDLREWRIATDFDGAELMQWMTDHGVSASLVWEDAHYKFESVVHKPYVVYTQWDVWVLDQPLLAIVWPRKMSQYQERVMRDFFVHLQRYHVVTISWWAPGVDMLAHELSLEHGIPTVAVLGTWFQPALVSAKRHLLHKVVQAWWCVLSEFRLRQKAAPWTFPQRNRIIAWLADMVFLPWAAKKSGSLITVDFASKMHVPVYTVPWSVYDKQCAGTNRYLATNKISCIGDVAQCLDQYFTRKQSWWTIKNHAHLSPDQQEVMTACQWWVCSLAQLWSATKKSVSELLAILSELEILGLLVQEVWGWRVS